MSPSDEVKFLEQLLKQITIFSFFPQGGRRRDGFTYVLYLNGGHPPWRLLDYMSHCCQICLSVLNPWSLTKAAFRKVNLAWFNAMPRIRQIAHGTTAVFSWSLGIRTFSEKRTKIATQIQIWKFEIFHFSDNVIKISYSYLISTLSGYKFAAPWAMIMHSSSFESSKPYIFDYYLVEHDSTFKQCNLTQRNPIYVVGGRISNFGIVCTLFWPENF